MVKRYLGLTIGQILLIAWTALTLLPFLLILAFSFRNNAGLYSVRMEANHKVPATSTTALLEFC